MRFSLITLLLTTLFCQSASGEGLIYQLPPDGTWVSYEIDDILIDADGNDKSVTGELKLSSVGKLEVGGEPCRWIEIAFQFEVDGRKTSHSHKLLIPEKALAAGKDPLKNSIRIYRTHSSSANTIKIEGADIERYLQRDNLPLKMFFHGPYENPKSLPAEMIDSKLGKKSCEGIQATETTSQNTISVERKYTIHLHKDAPFGVVQWKAIQKIARNGKPDGVSDEKLTLKDFGTDAKSALPDSE